MPTKGGSTQITISSWTIVKGLVILAAAFLLFFLRDIVLLVVVAMLLAAVMDPLADWMQKRKLPRGLAVLVIYALVAVIAIGAMVLIVPSMTQEFRDLYAQYAPYIEQMAGVENIVASVEQGIFDQDIAGIVETARQSGLADAIPELTSVIFSAFGGVLTAILILILAFYLVIEEKEVKETFVAIAPKRHRERVKNMLVTSRQRIGFWVRGQLLLMLIIFVISYVVLTILGVPFALVLAFLAGLLEIIPFLGPNIAAIPAIIIAFSVSPAQAIFVAIAYFLIQQLEADYLTPKIMQKVAGLNPVMSIVALLVGFKVAGVIGALIAIPLTMILGVFWTEWLEAKE